MEEPTLNEAIAAAIVHAGLLNPGPTSVPVHGVNGMIDYVQMEAAPNPIGIALHNIAGAIANAVEIPDDIIEQVTARIISDDNLSETVIDAVADRIANRLVGQKQLDAISVAVTNAFLDRIETHPAFASALEAHLIGIDMGAVNVTIARPSTEVARV
jgi:hypothetical protein